MSTPYKIVSLLKSHKIMKNIYKSIPIEVRTIIEILGIGVISIILIKMGIVK